MNPAALTLVAGLLLSSPQSPEAAQPQLASLRTVFRELPGDFRRLASLNTVLILGTGGGLALSVAHEDAEITHAVVESRGFDRTLGLGSALGSGYTQFSVALGTLLIGRMTNKPRVAATGQDLLSAQLVTGVITQGIKFAARRRRPNGGSYSFPSGHTSAAFATASVLQRHFGWKIAVPAYALGGYIAASRLRDNEHYLSDVIFGAAIGTVAGRVVRIHWGSGELSASAVPLRGGGAVLLVLTPDRATRY